MTDMLKAAMGTATNAALTYRVFAAKMDVLYGGDSHFKQTEIYRVARMLYRMYSTLHQAKQQRDVVAKKKQMFEILDGAFNGAQQQQEDNEPQGVPESQTSAASDQAPDAPTGLSDDAFKRLMALELEVRQDRMFWIMLQHPAVHADLGRVLYHHFDILHANPADPHGPWRCRRIGLVAFVLAHDLTLASPDDKAFPAHVNTLVEWLVRLDQAIDAVESVATNTSMRSAIPEMIARGGNLAALPPAIQPVAFVLLQLQQATRASRDQLAPGKIVQRVNQAHGSSKTLWFVFTIMQHARILEQDGDNIAVAFKEAAECSSSVHACVATTAAACEFIDCSPESLPEGEIQQCRAAKKACVANAAEKCKRTGQGCARASAANVFLQKTSLSRTVKGFLSQNMDLYHKTLYHIGASHDAVTLARRERAIVDRLSNILEKEQEIAEWLPAKTSVSELLQFYRIMMSIHFVLLVFPAWLPKFWINVHDSYNASHLSAQSQADRAAMLSLLRLRRDPSQILNALGRAKSMVMKRASNEHMGTGSKAAASERGRNALRTAGVAPDDMVAHTISILEAVEHMDYNQDVPGYDAIARSLREYISANRARLVDDPFWAQRVADAGTLLKLTDNKSLQLSYQSVLYMVLSELDADLEPTLHTQITRLARKLENVDMRHNSLARVSEIDDREHRKLIQKARDLITMYIRRCMLPEFDMFDAMYFLSDTGRSTLAVEAAEAEAARTGAEEDASKSAMQKAGEWVTGSTNTTFVTAYMNDFYIANFDAMASRLLSASNAASDEYAMHLQHLYNGRGEFVGMLERLDRETDGKTYTFGSVNDATWHKLFCEPASRVELPGQP